MLKRPFRSEEGKVMAHKSIQSKHRCTGLARSPTTGEPVPPRPVCHAPTWIRIETMDHIAYHLIVTAELAGNLWGSFFTGGGQ